jgi:hypothetical protein
VKGAHGRSEERAFTGRYFPERITLEPSGGGSALERGHGD